ncbi:CIR protein [Plasmodium chabaudi chabaudi]|uniref:CIR protein n=1 Tax=Plasmodium chabaudi chabaudi TaxID=31271 RepID=A0A4V0K7Y0_PLACU|nr:CIR protein [Plasmodium chabaudi chabaudi]VTZ68593.1 CIR protein [Plasmodium chabaudi chabaudi]|eukprot:XP_016652896.1 CIR protein [Plasmodium chabaudi chabaudi]
MTKSSYDIEKYKEFVTINSYFGEEKKQNGEISLKCKEEIHNYCHYGNTSEKGNCNNEYFKMTSSGVIYLLENLKKYGLDDDKLADYAILWLSYKLKIKENNIVNKLSDFYNSYIETNNDYNKNINGNDGPTYKEIIDKKKDLMDMNISEIFKLEAPFNILYFLYYEISDVAVDCKKNLSIANNFAKEFEKLNNDSNNKENSLYTQILSTLSNDYKNLKKKCPQFQSISEIKRSQSSAENSVKVSEQPTVLIPEATPSSSSILNTVIPVLSTFSVISLFLGVSYKYSLFGFGKRSQKRYLRENIKK